MGLRRRDSSDYLLLPIANGGRTDRAWPRGRAVAAVCDCGPACRHEAPVNGCTCGYWAFQSLEGLLDVMRPAATLQPTVGPDVIGSVWLWGKVIRTERGFRAQYAYPREIFVAAGLDPLAERGKVAEGLGGYAGRVRVAEDLGFVFDRRRTLLRTARTDGIDPRNHEEE